MRAQLEELAANLVLGWRDSEAGRGIAAQFALLGDRALAEGYQEASRIAAIAAQRINCQNGVDGEENKSKLTWRNCDKRLRRGPASQLRQRGSSRPSRSLKILN